MRKDITKKFLMRYTSKTILEEVLDSISRKLSGSKINIKDKMISKDIVAFIIKNKINIDTNQISYDGVCFKNVFSTRFISIRDTNNILISKNIVEKNGKRIEFNMIHCGIDKYDSGFLLGETEFTLGETEVTQELYELVMDYNPSEFKGKEDSNKRPVDCVTWYDAIMFCNKLSLLTNKRPYYEIKGIEYEDKTQTNIKKANVEINETANGFRLPLSEEWKYAAKAGTNNRWSGTNNENKLKEYAWFGENSKINPNDKEGQTHPVATKKPNEWGLYDMIGNVWEWCYDAYSQSNSDSRVCHGGCWITGTSINSNYYYPKTASVQDKDVGFRVSIYL